MVAMMGDASGFAYAVVDHVGMGETVDDMRAVTVGKHCWGHYEAERSERRKRNREPEAESLRQCRQHQFGLLRSLQTRA
jgi:hypothetical protein